MCRGFARVIPIGTVLIFDERQYLIQRHNRVEFIGHESDSVALYFLGILARFSSIPADVSTTQANSLARPKTGAAALASQRAPNRTPRTNGHISLILLRSAQKCVRCERHLSFEKFC